MRMIPEDLRYAYEATLYRVDGPCPRDFRLADSPADCRAWLDAVGAGSAIVITGFNPFSVVFPEQANRFANQRLREQLNALGLRTLPADGRDPAGTWSEESFCVLDAPDPLADELLVEYGQNALLAINGEVGPKFRWHPGYRSESAPPPLGFTREQLDRRGWTKDLIGTLLVPNLGAEPRSGDIDPPALNAASTVAEAEALPPFLDRLARLLRP